MQKENLLRNIYTLGGGGARDVKAMDCGIVLSSNSSRAITFTFGLIILGKVWTPNPLSYGLNSTTAVLLEGWRWYQITHQGWYAIKQTKQLYKKEAGVSDFLLWTLHMDVLVLVDQELIWISSVRTQCRLEDLPGAKVDQNRWREREREKGSQGNPCCLCDSLITQKTLLLPLIGQTSFTCSNVPWETVYNENNMYISLNTTTFSRHLTMHLNDSSSIALHLKTLSIPESKFQKILVENITIKTHEINKLRQQILEGLHIKTKTKNRINRTNVENNDNVLKCLKSFFFLIFFSIIFYFRW